ncbi:hypothetical protein CHLRE_16g673821v5 [Chlamydomonas reinhardtii]|uniref:Protein kinase domain-containing protein n=1 Tax=Chlamydomonas reinhardtii TaxID=3055 RepID=A0A2K3CTZ7_CHLRE|nr:uncharacterized protein CHLRE_16g673821v5 [Chlamydomonas reinhardtii]PNW71755.1 hypothetical protein CHLRE_16g673821v5 [Chlamydomonas reinhardtii]
MGCLLSTPQAPTAHSPPATGLGIAAAPAEAAPSPLQVKAEPSEPADTPISNGGGTATDGVGSSAPAGSSADPDSGPRENASTQDKMPASTNGGRKVANNKHTLSAVDKGTQLIESLSAIEGTAVEKVEAFTSLLVGESYVQFASISVVSEDEQVFMVLTAAGVGSDFLPKHYLLNVASSHWSVQRVVSEGTACFWAAGEHNANELPEDWKCLFKMQKLKSFLAVPIKVGAQLVGVLNVALVIEVDEQKHWWGLQLRLLAAVLAQHFHDAHLRSKVSWLQSIAKQETVEQLSMATLKGLTGIFDALQDLSFYIALVLPGRPCAIMFSLSREMVEAAAGERKSPAYKEHVDMHGFVTNETLLENALATGQVMKVANMRRYLRLYKTGADVAILYKSEGRSPASVMVLPLVAPDAARIGGLYAISRTATDFGMVRREVMDLVKLMVPTLQQKLYSELNKKLIEVSEICKFESLSATGANAKDELGTSDSATLESTKDLVLGTRPEKDALIAELQEQIRRQLAKVYKGHPDPGPNNMLEDLEVYDELGRGGYGTVYRAIYKGQLAAVKVVCDRDVDNGSLNGALELALLTSISHPNIIQIHTYYADVPLNSIKFVRGHNNPTSQKDAEGGGPGGKDASGKLNRPGEQNCQVLVMDFCDMGSLADVLNTSLLRHHAGKVAMPAILHCLLEVASALHYLHSIGIVHYDLKPENVLLKSSTIDSRGFNCKVADFGLSNIVSDNSYFNKHAEGTITHLAPEAMQPNGKLTKAVDVYAFGIMMWELYTGLRPYTGYRTIDVAVKVSKEGLRPEFPSTTHPSFKELAQRCWQGDRRLRPTFRQVMDRIHEMLKDAELMGRESLLTLSSSAARLPVYPDYLQVGEDAADSEFPLHIL